MRPTIRCQMRAVGDGKVLTTIGRRFLLGRDPATARLSRQSPPAVRCVHRNGMPYEHGTRACSYRSLTVLSLHPPEGGSGSSGKTIGSAGPAVHAPNPVSSIAALVISHLQGLGKASTSRDWPDARRVPADADLPIATSRLCRCLAIALRRFLRSGQKTGAGLCSHKDAFSDGQHQSWRHPTSGISRQSREPGLGGCTTPGAESP